MKYVSEYRESALVKKWAAAIQKIVTRPWTLMEVCGGQTHTIVKYGLQDLLPAHIRLIHGPGCPVCVTPISLIDHALYIAAQPNTLFCSFGDMLRVPGSDGNLLTLRARGADVRIVHSPLEAVKLAEDNPSKEVIFFAVGFETTAPATAMAAELAKKRGIKNFSLLVSHVLVPPAMELLLGNPDNQIQGFLAAGHVCTVTGYEKYFPIAEKYRTPIVVTGFEPTDILQGIYLAIEALEKGECAVLNQYSRSVQAEGNVAAQKLVSQVFEVVNREWRGIGVIPQSGLGLRTEYGQFDAALRFPFHTPLPKESGCIGGLILQGKKRPSECPFFGQSCNPHNPMGALMVSSEGACAAYFQHAPDPRKLT